MNYKPFYLQREFSSFIVVGVYIPPPACVSEAQNQLVGQIAKKEKKIIISMDLYSANLTHELPKCRQQIKCSSRDAKLLDHCYTAIKDALCAVPCAAHGLSDHCLLHLIATYRKNV